MKYYCGPYWLPKVFRKALSNKFNASCKIHDMDYESKKYSRKQADIRFKCHILRQAGDSMIYYVIAKMFYYSVRLGGAISWRKD